MRILKCIFVLWALRARLLNTGNVGWVLDSSEKKEISYLNLPSCLHLFLLHSHNSSYISSICLQRYFSYVCETWEGARVLCGFIFGSLFVEGPSAIEIVETFVELVCADSEQQSPVTKWTELEKIHSWAFHSHILLLGLSPPLLSCQWSHS